MIKDWIEEHFWDLLSVVVAAIVIAGLIVAAERSGQENLAKSEAADRRLAVELRANGAAANKAGVPANANPHIGRGWRASVWLEGWIEANEKRGEQMILVEQLKKYVRKTSFGALTTNRRMLTAYSYHFFATGWKKMPGEAVVIDLDGQLLHCWGVKALTTFTRMLIGNADRIRTAETSVSLECKQITFTASRKEPAKLNQFFDLRMAVTFAGISRLGKPVLTLRLRDDAAVSAIANEQGFELTLAGYWQELTPLVLNKQLVDV